MVILFQNSVKNWNKKDESQSVVALFKFFRESDVYLVRVG
jgi:hypothetical protein